MTGTLNNIQTNKQAKSDWHVFNMYRNFIYNLIILADLVRQPIGNFHELWKI